MNQNRKLMITILVVGIAILAIGVYSVAMKSTSETIPFGRTSIVSSKRLSIPANQMWVDTGVQLKAGQSFSVQSQGQWRWDTTPGHACGGNGMGQWHGLLVNDAPLAGLVARVGDRSFFTGSNYSGASPASGNLFLSINDDPTSFIDNEGSLDVTILVQ